VIGRILFFRFKSIWRFGPSTSSAPARRFLSASASYSERYRRLRNRSCSLRKTFPPPLSAHFPFSTSALLPYSFHAGFSEKISSPFPSPTFSAVGLHPFFFSRRWLSMISCITRRRLSYKAKRPPPLFFLHREDFPLR